MGKALPSRERFLVSVAWQQWHVAQRRSLVNLRIPRFFTSCSFVEHLKMVEYSYWRDASSLVKSHTSSEVCSLQSCWRHLCFLLSTGFVYFRGFGMWSRQGEELSWSCICWRWQVRRQSWVTDMNIVQRRWEGREQYHRFVLSGNGGLGFLIPLFQLLVLTNTQHKFLRTPGPPAKTSGPTFVSNSPRISSQIEINTVQIASLRPYLT